MGLMEWQRCGFGNGGAASLRGSVGLKALIISLEKLLKEPQMVKNKVYFKEGNGGLQDIGDRWSWSETYWV